MSDTSGDDVCAHTQGCKLTLGVDVVQWYDVEACRFNEKRKKIQAVKGDNSLRANYCRIFVFVVLFWSTH